MTPPVSELAAAYEIMILRPLELLDAPRCGLRIDVGDRPPRAGDPDRAA